MVRVIGIDEAGYGPTLGPLVIGASCWDMPIDLVAQDHWAILKTVVRRTVKQDDALHLAIDDSKRVFDRKKGLHTLERGVLAFARAAGMPCDRFTALLDACCTPEPRPAGLPWYDAPDMPLPTDPVRSAVAGIARRLDHALRAANLRCVGLRARVVTETWYNRRVAATDSKAALLVEQIQRFLVACAADCSQPAVCYIDRLGGRTDYRSHLAEAFPRHELQEVEITDQRSAYRLRRRGAPPLTVVFGVDGDQKHLPISLASMVAKYVRELCMLRFNAFWQALLPTVKPTAGYFKDADRFLREIKGVVPQAGLPREHFVRAR